MRQPPQHFVLLKTLRLRTPAYDPVNGALYSVYATLTIAPDFEPTLKRYGCWPRKAAFRFSEIILCGGKTKWKISYLLLRTVSRRKLRNGSADDREPSSFFFGFERFRVLSLFYCQQFLMWKHVFLRQGISERGNYFG